MVSFPIIDGQACKHIRGSISFSGLTLAGRRSRLSRKQAGIQQARFYSAPILMEGDTRPVNHVYLSLSRQHSQGLDDGPGRQSNKKGRLLLPPVETPSQGRRHE